MIQEICQLLRLLQFFLRVMLLFYIYQRILFTPQSASAIKQSSSAVGPQSVPPQLSRGHHSMLWFLWCYLLFDRTFSIHVAFALNFWHFLPQLFFLKVCWVLGPCFREGNCFEAWFASPNLTSLTTRDHSAFRGFWKLGSHCFEVVCPLFHACIWETPACMNMEHVVQGIGF